MARERQHFYRERGGTLGQEGQTARARNCYGVFNPNTGVCFKLFPQNTEGIRQAYEEVQKTSTKENPRTAMPIPFQTVMLYQPEGATEPRRVIHGVNDGAESEHQNNAIVPARSDLEFRKITGGNWID